MIARGLTICAVAIAALALIWESPVAALAAGVIGVFGIVAKGLDL